MDGVRSWVEEGVGWSKELDGGRSWMEEGVGWRKELDGGMSGSFKQT